MQQIEEQDKLPKLRSDIDIFETSCAEDGSKQWLLYEPIQNKYFTIGIDAFELLSHWEDSIDADKFIEKLKKRDYEIDQNGIKEFINFLESNHLIVISNKEQKNILTKLNNQKKQNILKWLVHNYLFIRIPLLKPDRWLEKYKSLFDIFYTKYWSSLVFILGIFGILMSLQAWDEFTSTFLYFFSKEGMFYYFISLIFVKSTHELGHAVTAKRYGCKIPSMGVAFLVLFPVLYTDATDSWKLKSKYKRLKIVVAGMKVELYLALIATFLWSFLPDGVFKSVVFIIATTSWITSLLVNISPFLRFDGYYALSDISNSKNLQPRSFALTKWFIRKTILGIEQVVPESLPKGKKIFFISYAIATIIYRFFLFLGIAFLVYHAAFKVLGIILFMVEILWFILLPVYKELAVWWKLKEELFWNKNNIISLSLFIIMLFLFFYPWQTTINLPAVLETKQFNEIYTPKSAQIKELKIKSGTKVKKGDELIVLHSPDLNHKIESLQKEIELLNAELDKISASNEVLAYHFVMQEILLQKQNELESFQKINQSLVLKAPSEGMVYFAYNLHVDEWINHKKPLLNFYDSNAFKIIAMVQESDKNSLHVDTKSLFISDNLDEESYGGKIVSISNISKAFLLYPELSSDFGGNIATKKQNKKLRTQKAYYEVEVELDDGNKTFDIRKRGVLKVYAKPQSIFTKVFILASSILLKESGF